MEKAVLFCVFSYLIVQITSSDVSEHDVSLLRVQMNESITLSCRLNDRYDEIAWYRQNPDSGRLSLLIFARIFGTKSFFQNGRLTFTADMPKQTVSLVITGLTESDSGLYFCGSKKINSEMQFEKPIRIQMEEQLTDSEDEARSDEEITDGLTLTERAMLFGGAALAVLVFFLVAVITGRSIYYHGWQKGWTAAEHTGLTVQKTHVFHCNQQVPHQRFT